MEHDPEQDAAPDPAGIEADQFYPHPPSMVWRALTDSSIVAQWFLESVGYSARVGGHFMFLIPSDPAAEIACEVAVAEPPRLLTWDWRDMRSTLPVNWPVSWSVVPHGRGSRLLLTQRGFDLDDKRQRLARTAMGRFWRTPLARLGPVLEAL